MSLPLCSVGLFYTELPDKLVEMFKLKINSMALLFISMLHLLL